MVYDGELEEYAEDLIADAMEGIIYLADEDDNDVPFRYLDEIEYEGKNYAVLLPLDEDDSAAEVVILEVEQDADDEEYDCFNGVEDESVLSAVYDIFRKNHEGEFVFPE